MNYILKAFISKKIRILSLVLIMNSCWFINHYDKEEAIEKLSPLFLSHKKDLNHVYNELVKIKLENCVRYMVSTGRGIDYWTIERHKVDTLKNGSLRYVFDELNIKDENGIEIKIDNNLPKATFFWITYIQNIGVFFHLDDVQSSRFIDGEINSLYIVKFTSMNNFCKLNETLCKSKDYYTDKKYLTPLEDGWYLYESYGTYSPNEYFLCTEFSN